MAKPCQSVLLKTGCVGAISLLFLIATLKRKGVDMDLVEGRVHLVTRHAAVETSSYSEEMFDHDIITKAVRSILISLLQLEVHLRRTKV